MENSRIESKSLRHRSPHSAGADSSPMSPSTKPVWDTMQIGRSNGFIRAFCMYSQGLGLEKCLQSQCPHSLMYVHEAKYPLHRNTKSQKPNQHASPVVLVHKRNDAIHKQ